MKNIHILPTDKPSRLIYNDANQLCYHSNKSFKNDRKWMHRKKFNIYITDDSEIKEGDWFIALDGSNDIYKANKVWLDIIKENSNPSQKIILTTDQDLIKDGVQAIDDEFLQWFVNNPSCESVQVDKNWNYPLDKNWEYKIIIPQEEPNPLNVGKEFYESADKNITVYRQETLEEAAERLYPDGCDGTNRSAEIYRRIFIESAKWQQEQDKNKYSEEEVLVKLYECLGHFAYQHNIVINGNEIDKWFEQFKKK
jgi:hypothetical protein